MLEQFVNWLATVPSVSVYAALIALCAIENVFPPAPSDVGLVLGAFLGHRGVTSPVLLGLLCWSSNTGSSAWVYLYARRRGPSLFASGWLSKLLSPGAQRALHQAYDRYGIAGVFFCRLLPGIRVAVMPFAGVVRIPAARVLVPSAAASAVWYTLLVFAGTLMGDNWQHARGVVESVNRALAAVSLLSLTALATWLWRRARAE